MQTNTSTSESKTDSTKTPTTTIPKPPGASETTIPAPVENQTHDDFGYAKETEETPPVDEKKKDEEVIKPSTGYKKSSEEPSKKEETPPVDEKKKEETPPVDEKKKDETPPVDEEKADKEIDEVLSKLPDGFDKEIVSKFAKDNKFTKEQTEAYVNLVNETEAANAEKHKQLVESTRLKWEQELKEDPEFGGENFDLNLDRAEKVLQKYFPNTKKMLTERGSMVPPYIMKDFYALYKIFNPKEPLVTGDPVTPEETGSHLDILYK